MLLLHRGLMLTISKVLTFLSTLPVWEQGIPWQLSKQISKLFFQMSVQVYSVPGQTTERWKVFLDWKNIDLSSKLYRTCGVMLTIIKVFIILLLPWEQGTSCQFSIERPGILSSQPNSRREEGLFGGCKKGVTHCEITP